jgi:uncharacterized membrane protein YczE
MMSSAGWARLALVIILGSLTIWSLRNHPISLIELRRRLPRCVAGLACFGLGIALFIEANLGNPPWDILHAGLAKKLGLPVGLVVNLVGVAVLGIWIPLRERVGLGTVLNTLEIGFTVDLFLRFIPRPNALLERWAFAVVGMLVIGIGSGLYIGSGLGAGPRDGVMLGLRRFGLSVRTARSLIELATMGLGFALGGKIGFATAFFMLAIGPLVQVSLKHLALPPLPNDTSTTRANETSESSSQQGQSLRRQ